MKQRLLETALWLNTGFSGLSGALLLAVPGTWARLMGPAMVWPFALTGALLLGFAGFVGWCAWDVHRRRGWVIPILVADMGWVLATPVVMIVAGPALTSTGDTLLVVVALAVAGLAAAQWLGLRVMSPTRG